MLFAAHGYAAVGLEQVAEAAGVTRGAVYHHFDSKRGLFAAVLAAVHAEAGESVAAAADQVWDSDPWEGFEAGCRAFLEFSLSADVRRIMLLDGPAIAGWAAWRDDDAAASGHHLVEALEELTQLDLLDAPSIPAAGALLSGAMNEAVLWVASHPTHEYRRALDQAWSTLRILLSALRATGR
ncbi:helix-turn-helix domain-containing protein [Brevibacterium picturae]|uniref:TetR/AcrR family transcriptional regulator n=1 Tax=Brevibacterium picturae TaxID=260553 RepID=A0ABP4LS98_9MICO